MFRARTFICSCLLVASSIGVAGCASQDLDTDPTHGDLNGYYEYRDQGVVYVVGSITSLDAMKAGKMPKTTTAGFSAQGQPVLFETGEAGLSQRLIASYEQRHGLSK